eukprot:Rhum_TRINITY_DN12217_c0_g2::Rhum_TRINITY_DN12217_c0_g2_i1::g.50196::m.50196
MPPASRRAPAEEDETTGYDRFCNDWVKKILTFFVILCCIGTGVCCVFVLMDAFSSSSSSGKDKDTSRYSASEKVTAVVNYMFWLVVSTVLLLVEWEPIWMFNYALFLHYWPGRGLAQIYMGIQIVHEAADMSKTKVFGLDGSSLKTIVQAIGWCFVGTGLLYILLSCCCVRGKDSGNVVNKLRKGKTYESQDSSLSRTPVANLALLKKMNNDGVAHLSQAIMELESQVDEEKRTAGVTGWFRKKFGDDKKAASKKPRQDQPSPASASSTDAALVAQGVQNVHAVDITPTGRKSESDSPSLEMVDRGGYGDGYGGGRDVRDTGDDDIRRRREEEDARLEAQYYASRVSVQ